MLMTEEQARTKWCPHARIVDGYSEGAGGCNRWVNKSDEILCIASGCMAWRWRSKRSVVFSDRPDGDDGLTGMVNERPNYEGDEPRGYCGAFGRPEA